MSPPGVPHRQPHWQRYYPGRPIEAKVRFFLQELLEGG
jgi:hypothetical protein